ncbi:MAG: hypothetical protein H0W42_03060 [Gemmatimonadaceae bacterium]|nr:hypothetical protein [Gemmatimonadaceae bacterium]
MFSPESTSVPPISDDPNVRRGPRLDLLTTAGWELLSRDPDAYNEEQRIIAEEAGKLAGEDRARTLTSAKQREIVDEALERFKLVSELEDKQRKREVEDMKFDRGLLEDQWDAADLASRKELGYPCLVVSKLEMPIAQVENEMREARLGVTVRPRGKKANQDGAEVRQGLYRAIEVDSRAHIAREWAAGRAMRCGRGFYRVVKVFNNDGDFDMDIGIKRILNQGSVYLDPWATEPDWSDGEWALITEDIPRARYARMYRNSDIDSLEQMVAEGDKPPDWVTDDHVRIAEYFRVSYVDRYLVFDPESKKSQLLPAGQQPPDDLDTEAGWRVRRVDQRKVEWYVINAAEVLDTETWEGRYIPIVPVIGKEHLVDGSERVWKGMISGGKDAQRMINYFKSLQVQAAHLTTRETYMGDIRAFERWEGHDAWKGIRILPINQEVNGVQIEKPDRMFKEPELQAITMVLRDLDHDIKSVTGRHSASLGEFGPDRSGKAIRELKAQGEQSTSGYLKNFAHISLTYEAKIILDLMRYVYDTERVIRIMGEQDKERTIMINGAFYETPDGPVPAADPETGIPNEPPGAPPPGMLANMGTAMTGQPMPAKEAPKLTRYDLTQDEDYSFVVTVQPSHQTQRQEDASVYEAIIKADANLAKFIGPLWVKSLEGPAAQEAYNLLLKAIPELKAATDEEAPEIPPEVQQQLQQSQQMIQELTQALEQKTQAEAANTQKLTMEATIKREELAGRQQIEAGKAQASVAEMQAKAESEVMLMRAKAEIELATRRAELDAEGQQKIELARIEAESKRQIALEQIAFEREKLQLEIATKRELAQLDRDTKTSLAQQAAVTSAAQEARKNV